MDEGRETAPCARAHALSLDGRFLLRAFNGWTWAREAANPQPERTWVLPVDVPRELDAPLPNAGSSVEHPPPDALGLAQWFALGEEKQLARAVWFYDQHRTNRFYTLFFCPDGRGLLREPWNRDDIPFRWANPSEASAKRVRDGLFAGFRSLAQEVFLEQLWPVLDEWNEDEDAPETYSHIELDWLCGSEEELERLLRLFAWSDVLLCSSHTPIQLSLSSENAFERAGLTGVRASNVRAFLSHDWKHQSVDGIPSFWQGEVPPRLLELVELALDENTPVGLEWEYADNFSGRASHTPQAPGLQFRFSPPTMHEHIEAKLELRNWLRERVSVEDVERLLGT